MLGAAGLKDVQRVLSSYLFDVISVILFLSSSPSAALALLLNCESSTCSLASGPLPCRPLCLKWSSFTCPHVPSSLRILILWHLLRAAFLVHCIRGCKPLSEFSLPAFFILIAFTPPIMLYLLFLIIVYLSTIMRAAWEKRFSFSLYSLGTE